MAHNKPRKITIAEEIEINLRQTNAKQKAALMVIVLDPRIRGFLADHDPKALQQCREALNLDKLIERHFPTRSEAEDFAALYTDTIDKL